MLRRTTLGLAAWASASAMAAVDPKAIEKIHDPSQCPLSSNALVVKGVIPHLSTLPDATGVPMTVTLFHKGGYEYNPNQWPYRLSLCAFTPEGQFIGGSSVPYSQGSRMWFNQYTGSQGVSLARLLQTTTEALNGREFQLHFSGDSFSIFEYGVSGNNKQTQAFSRAPIAPVRGVWLPEVSGGVGTLDTVLYISRPSRSTSVCEVAASVYEDEGIEITAESRVTIPPGGMARIRLSKVAPSVSGAVKVRPVTEDLCGNLYVSRETTYRSGAFGGKGLFIDYWN